MNKTLHSMPKAIYGSALVARDTWYSRPITRCAEWLDYASLLTSAISKWVVGFWWLLGTIPPLAETFAASRGYILGYFVGLVLLAFLAFVCNIAIRKPLAERGWPCVAPIEPTFAGSLRVNGLREAFTAGAAWPALIFGTLLMLSAGYAAKEGYPIVWADVGYAAMSLAIGMAAIVLDLFPPTFGIKIPSWGEFHAARAEHERRTGRGLPPACFSEAGIYALCRHLWHAAAQRQTPAPCSCRTDRPSGRAGGATQWHPLARGTWQWKDGVRRGAGR
jgi:hypothetical protein